MSVTVDVPVPAGSRVASTSPNRPSNVNVGAGGDSLSRRWPACRAKRGIHCSAATKSGAKRS